QNPDRTGQVAELRRERRADQGPRARDRGEVVAEHDPAVGRHEVPAVVETLGRRRARRVEREHLGRDERTVETIAYRVDADGRDDEPQSVYAFAAVQRDAGKRERA